MKYRLIAGEKGKPNRIEFNTGSGGRKDYCEWETRPDGSVEITDIAVYSQRCKGMGRALVQTLEAVVPPGTACIYAFCRGDNRAGRAFYPKVGFRLEAVVDCYYASGDRVGVLFVKAFEVSKCV
jgi:ribosomal protein S18 acetylase RimI-like enzyme